LTFTALSSRIFKNDKQTTHGAMPDDGEWLWGEYSMIVNQDARYISICKMVDNVPQWVVARHKGKIDYVYITKNEFAKIVL